MFRILSNSPWLNWAHRTLWRPLRVGVGVALRAVGAALRAVGSAWHRYWQPLGIIAGLVAAALAVTVVFWDWPHTGLVYRDERVDVIRTLGLIIGGGLALVVAVWRGKTAQSEADIGELDLLNKRYDNARALLASTEVVARLDGIRTLGAVAHEDPLRFRHDVVHTLCAFARHLTNVGDSESDPLITPLFRQSDQAPAMNYKRREEIEAAVRVVSECNIAAKAEDPDTRPTINLTGMALYEADFSRTDLSGAILERAQLIRVNLSGADLTDANLSFADLRSADLTWAKLVDANMAIADLRQAQLAWANFDRVQLQHAQMARVNLLYANFSGAELSLGQDETHLPELTRSLREETAASGLTQDIVDRMWAEDDNPPKLDGVKDAETGEPIEWRGGTPLPQGITSWPYD